MTTAAICGLVVLLLAGGCASGGAEDKAGALPSVTASVPKERRPVLSSARSATLGSVVIDARGNVLYRYEKDSAKPSRATCVGPCVKKWPPVLAGDELSTKGIDQNLVGRVKRPDGRWQLTLAGWPLYRYTGDRRAGRAKGQNRDGVWFAVAPDGTKAEPGGAAGDGAGGGTDNGAGGGTTANGTQTKWGPVGAADRELLVKMRQAWLWELPAAQQARSRAQRQQVKDAAGRLAAQRTGLDEDVRSIATGLRVTLPSGPGADQRKWMAELASAKGTQFDELFVNRLRAEQGRLLAFAAQVRASTRNSLVREFAQRAVDTVMKQMALLENTGLVADSAL